MSAHSILVLDPSVLSGNTGDEIISEAVSTELQALFPFHKLIRGYTQDFPSRVLLGKARNADLSIVAGTNLLSSDFSAYKQWMIGWRASRMLRNVVLLGVGWWQYQGPIAKRTGWLYKQVLSPSLPHSVRDAYTQQKLKSIGIKSINTACPTLWRVSTSPDSFPTRKSANAVITLTDYNKDPAADRSLLQLCQSQYSKIYFWPQGSGDLDYFRSLGVSGLSMLPTSLKAFDNLLDSSIDLEYVGTRLHAGIRALQKGRRSLIIGIDNRSKEMHADFDLPVVDRRDHEHILTSLASPCRQTCIRLPLAAIQEWRTRMQEHLGYASQ